MEASCWVERKIFLSPARASSRARTLASRPTMKGVICCGKITMSRTGIMGTRFISCFSRVNIQALETPLLRLKKLAPLPIKENPGTTFFRSASRPGLKPRVYRAHWLYVLCAGPFEAQGKLKPRPPKENNLSRLLEQAPIDLMAADHIRGHDKVPHLALHREVVHQLQHEVFEDHTQAARADFALKRQLRDSVDRVLGEAKTDILKLEKALVLLQERVLGFRENFHERALVQIAHDAGNGQAPHKFGDQAVADEVAGLHLFENLGIAALRRGGSGVGVKTQRMLANAAFDDLLQPDEGPTAYKQDIRRVHRGKFLVRVLAATLRRHVGNGAFENLEQGLLHALAADIAGDGGILVLLGDLVDFVDIDDALLGLLHIAIGGLQELQDDVLDVLTDVAGFGKGGGVHDGEGNIEHAGKGLRKERLARARGTDQDNIGLAEFHFTGLFVEENALVVVVNGHGEFFLGAILTNDVAIEELLDFGGPGQAARGSGGLFALLVFQNGLANAHTLIADVRARIVRRGTDQLLYLLLSLVAKGAAQGFVWAVFFHVCEGLVLRRKHRSIDSILGRILPRAKEKVSSTDSNQQRCAGLPVLVDDLINHAVFLGLLRIHDVIALDVLLDALDGLAGMLGKKLIDGGTHAQNLFGVQVDVGGLSAEAAHPGLMDEDA